MEENITMIYVRECFAYISSMSFMVSWLIFKSLRHFEFIFLYGIRECSNFIDLHAAASGDTLFFF